MKKLLLSTAILSVLMGCQKESYVAKFDATPQERAKEQIALVSSALASATNGWVATLPTFDGGGYSFYMKFDGVENVNMLSDINATSQATAATSYYRVKQDMGADLVFDSYNYISMLNDPASSVMGGTEKIGYRSDIEFIYDRMNGDTLFMIGKKFRQPLVMVKATEAQKTAYEASGLKANVDKTTNYFVTNKFPYVEIQSGTGVLKAAIVPNFTNTVAAGKRLELTIVNADNSVESAKGKIASTLDGIAILNGGLKLAGVTFVRFTWKDATTLALYDSTGKEYIVKDNLVPIVNINLLCGSKYIGIRSEYKTIYPGTSTAGTTLLNSYHNNLVRPTLAFDFTGGRIDLLWNVVNKRLTFNGVASQAPSEWTTSIVYNYTVNADGSYKFTTYQGVTGGYSGAAMLTLDTFFKNNSVTFDYYIDNGMLYCKVSSVENPSTVMTFLLR